MNAARSQKMLVDWSAAKDGRAGCKAQIRKFVRGINGPRKNPVTEAQILRWVSCTPREFASECLTELVSDGAIRICQRSLSSTRRANGAYVYEVAETAPHKADELRLGRSYRDERELANMIVGAVGANVPADASLRDLLAAAYKQIVANREREHELFAAIRKFQDRGDEPAQ